ncbi:MAG: RidA family protein [Deltaproteobacteria bacterium]|nr:RidA family protein [Deltaproteobacteria bacterium]
MNNYLWAIAIFMSLFAVQPSGADQTSSIEFYGSGKILPKNLPISEAVRHGNTLFLSAQIGNLPGTFTLVPGGVKEEAKQAMKNIKTLVEAHGYSMQDLVKCTVVLADMSEWTAFNEIYKSFFTDKYPARSALVGSGLILGARVQVECLAAKEK